MGIWNFFSERRNHRLIEQISREVAQQSCEPVLQRVRRRAVTMRIAEARGYVRSRALEIVHRELSAFYHGSIPLAAEVQTRIISRATDEVVVHVLAELRSVPKSAKAITQPIQRQAAYRPAA